MIPDQPIGDACPFLQWVDAAGIPDPGADPFVGTVYQLVATFFHLAATYRVRLAHDTFPEFETACHAVSENCLIRTPYIYFRCAEQPERYLRFAWFTYAALLIGET